MTVVEIDRLKDVAAVESGDIVHSAIIPGPNRLRILLKEGSYVDVWFSLKLAGRYSYHWERRPLDSTLYRHDMLLTAVGRSCPPFRNTFMTVARAR